MNGIYGMGYVTPSVIGAMSSVAGALGTPGFSYASPLSPLLWGGLGAASYFGTSGFRGVANIAEGANNMARGFPWDYGLSWGGGSWGMGDGVMGMGGLGMFGWVAPYAMALMGVNPYPQAAQPAGPAQPAPPQPAPPPAMAPKAVAPEPEVEEKKEEPKKPVRYPRRPLNAQEQRRLQELEDRKNSWMFWRRLNAAEQDEYNRLKRRNGVR